MCKDNDEIGPGNFSLPPGDRSLAGLVMQGRDLMDAQLADVDLTGADLYWGSLQGSVLQGAILRDCCLRGAWLNNANLREADLTHADLSLDNLGGTTHLESADLTGADLRRAKIGGALFTKAMLIGADLRGVLAKSILPAERPTRFDGADLTDAKLGGVDWTGCIYNDETRFPRGFNPGHAGMVHVSDMEGPKRKKKRAGKQGRRRS
jgi:uncharacterized protein YjbI with pentapeptide repeats